MNQTDWIWLTIIGALIGLTIVLIKLLEQRKRRNHIPNRYSSPILRESTWTDTPGTDGLPGCQPYSIPVKAPPVLNVVRLLEPGLCSGCRFAELVTAVMASGQSGEKFHCRRLDCDNWQAEDGLEIPISILKSGET